MKNRRQIKSYRWKLWMKMMVVWSIFSLQYSFWWEWEGKHFFTGIFLKNYVGAVNCLLILRGAPKLDEARAFWSHRTSSEDSGSLYESSEEFRLLWESSETFGNLQKSPESFGSLQNSSEAPENLLRIPQLLKLLRKPPKLFRSLQNSSEAPKNLLRIPQLLKLLRKPPKLFRSARNLLKIPQLFKLLKTSWNFCESLWNSFRPTYSRSCQNLYSIDEKPCTPVNSL